MTGRQWRELWRAGEATGGRGWRGGRWRGLATLLVACAFGPPKLAGAQSAPLYRLAGDAPGDRFGAALAGLGDVDGDGCADLAVGAPGADGNGTNRGQVRVVSGSDGAVLYTLVGAADHHALGACVARVPDVDGDGVDELLAGAPRDPATGGSALLVSGANGPTLRSFAGGGGDGRFGQSLCGLADLDGDGMGDVAIGAPLSDHAANNAGRVEVLSGASGALLLAFDGQGFDLFGTSVATAGDVDGDGLEDLWIGAPLSDVGAFNAGSAWLRSGADGSLLLAIHGAMVGDQLGQWLASAGDHDGDGRDDVLIGIPGADANGVDSGAAELRSSATGALLRRVPGPAAGVYMGSVAGPGDLDGDGRPELLVGAPSAAGHGAEAGRALVVWGPVGSPRSTLLGARASDWLGAAVAGVGDVDGDGWPDLAVGAPIHDDVVTEPGYAQVWSGRALAAVR